MKNSEFQKAYLKIIAEESLLIDKPQKVKKSLYMESFLGLFGGDKQQAKAAKKETMTDLQKAVPPPQKQEPNIFMKGLTGFLDTAGKVTDGVTGAVKHVPIVGNVVGQTVQTLNPLSKNFLNMKKLPDAFVKDYDSVAQPMKKFLKSDDGKKVVETTKVDPNNDQQVKALYGRYYQMRWYQQILNNQDILKSVEKKVEKDHKIQKKSDDKGGDIKEILNQIKDLMKDFDDGKYSITL